MQSLYSTFNTLIDSSIHASKYMRFVGTIVTFGFLAFTHLSVLAQPQLCLMAMMQSPNLKEAPTAKESVKRWLNFSAILHLEATDNLLKIYTTIGGTAGSKPTYEITVRSMEEAYLWVGKIQNQARTCQLEMFALPPVPSHTPMPKFIPKEPPFK
jgi:hypothetical protein